MKNRFRFFLLVVMVLASVVPATYAQDGYGEAPMLAEKVAAGELPPVEERLPAEPQVVEVVDQIGQYGGTWNAGLRGGNDGAWLFRTVGYEQMMRWTPDWSAVVPNIARDYEFNEEGSEYTFYLREGMKWSDGDDFNADDLMFWYEDIFMNETLTLSYASWLTAAGEPVVVEKIDDYTVKFTFAAPNGLFLQRLATPNDWLYVPSHYMKQFHPKYAGEDEVMAMTEEAGFETWDQLFGEMNNRWGNVDRPTLDAWMLTAPMDGINTQVTFVRNPYYWKVDAEGNQLPYIDYMSFEAGDDVNALVLRALAGEIDFQGRHIASLENKAVFFDNMEQSDYRFIDVIPSSMNSLIISLNLTHQDPVKKEIFNNKDFRIGLSYAINRQELIDTVMLGQGEPFQASPRPTSEFYNETLAKQYTEYDVDLANEHLDKVLPEKDAEGFRLDPNGERLSFAVETTTINQNWTDMLELITGYWAAVGVEMTVKVEDRSILYDRKEANEHDAVVWGGDGGLDVILEPRWYFPFSGESNFAELWQYYYNNDPRAGDEVPPEPALKQMELYDMLKGTADQELQAQYMNEILQIAQEQFWVMGISLPVPGYAIVKNNMHNVPEVMPGAWLYPNPAPYNTCQFYFDPITD